jgi:hypothetical protein
MPINTKAIGDGLLPNRYWVSISNNYYYFNNEAGGFDWIGDLELFPVKGKTIKVFPSYKMAKGWIDNKLYMGMDYDGIRVNCITIEDRLSGEIFSQTKELLPDDGALAEGAKFEDLRFSIKMMADAGRNFN